MNLLLLSMLLGADPTPSQAWPGFRGDGSSTSTAKSLPLKWSPTENLAWRTTLPGYGQSSPVVWGDLAFVTAVDGDQKEKLFVVAVDVKIGKVAWKKEFAAGQTGKNNPMMSRAAPTPVVDKEAVYAFFESGNVVALTHAGEMKWERSLAKDYGAFKNNHGVGSSPAQTDKAVVILIDDLGPSYLVALDKATGKNLWKADRKSRSSWTSPVVAKIAGKPAVLVSSSGSLDAYDAATGKEIATLDGLVGNNIPSPVVAGDLVVLGAGENRMKPDAVASAKSNCCVRLRVKGDKISFEPVWDGKKAICQHASPLVHQGHAYFVTKSGLVHCVDLNTGAERYAERLENQCWATPVGAGDHVFFFGK
ncbi:MAG: PQQ-like beta-propeller repeat protein, partial [Gemmataceae bacterium]|nr:PQQ-like beta-propeller repeat protein [Gemmataceae bacterium]